MPILSIRLGLIALFLLQPLLALAQGAGTPEQPTETAEIRQLIDRLEDPEARARLVSDLRLLLEQQQSVAEEKPPVDLLAILEQLVTDAWKWLNEVDPREVAISSLLSVVIIVAALVARWLLLTLVARLYRRLVHGRDKQAKADRGESAASQRRALPGNVRRLINLLIGVLTVALIAESWGAGLGELLGTGIGARIAETALAIVIILVITVVLWNVSEVLVTRLLSLAGRKGDKDRTARRLESLVPLLSGVMQGTIGVLSGLLILSELGVNIGPLLAGAGILGLAIGFGAQTLVKDLITGVIILLEDGAAVGDVIEVGSHAGLVEELRIRSIQLRDLSGVVHLVPYSDVTAIKNYTKDFSYYVFEVGVAYREDTDEVCKVLMEISDDIRKDDTLGPDILEPLEILGVDQFADSAVIIKARIKTKPIRQWAVGREFNRRMKKRFDEAGIEIPFPHRTLYFGEPKQGDAPPMHVALAAGGGQTVSKLAEK